MASERDRPSEADMMAMAAILDSMPLPKTAPASAAARDFLDKHLPALRNQALSALISKGEYAPQLLGYMDDGSLGIIDVSRATGGSFGDARSKDAVAYVHRKSLLIPSVRASVFCVEAWSVSTKAKTPEEAETERAKWGKDLSKHPDRTETVMFNMLYKGVDDIGNERIMQLCAFFPVNKVMSKSGPVHKYTTLGEPTIVDPNDPGQSGAKSMQGRFIP